jgi:WH1 domain
MSCLYCIVLLVVELSLVILFSNQASCIKLNSVVFQAFRLLLILILALFVNLVDFSLQVLCHSSAGVFFLFASEHSIVAARASVMIYDEGNRRWIPSGSSQGLSKIHIYQHTVNNTFRVVGRKLHDHEVLLVVYEKTSYLITERRF